MHSPFAIGLAGRLSDLILNYGFWFISHSQSVMDLCRPIRSLRVSISLIAKKKGHRKRMQHICRTALCQENLTLPSSWRSHRNYFPGCEQNANITQLIKPELDLGIHDFRSSEKKTWHRRFFEQTLEWW